MLSRGGRREQRMPGLCRPAGFGLTKVRRPGGRRVRRPPAPRRGLSPFAAQRTHVLSALGRRSAGSGWSPLRHDVRPAPEPLLALAQMRPPIMTAAPVIGVDRAEPVAALPPPGTRLLPPF